MAALVALAGGLAQAAELPQWDLSKLEGLDAAQWGPADADGAETFRPVKAGRTGVWKVPIWWGDSFRPPAGTVYVLAIRYKDVVSRPAVFSAHAGLGTYWRLSEIHRFGGQADGKWKVAEAPVSWDLLCRIRGENNTSFSIRTEQEDLPVGKVSVRLAAPLTPTLSPAGRGQGEGAGDAERYFRETREWVARLDAVRFPELPAVASEKPEIAEALKAQAIVPYVRACTVFLHQHSAPVSGEAGAPIKMRLTRDEFRSASFGIYANGRDLKNVTCRLSELTPLTPTLSPKGRGQDELTPTLSPKGRGQDELTPTLSPTGRGQGEGAGKLDCLADLKTVEYALVSSKVKGKEERAARKLPLRLWPSYAVDIPAGRSHGFWLTLRTQDGKSQPGIYRGKVTVQSGDETAEIALEAEVLPLRLLSVDDAGISMGACISALPPEQEMQTFQDYNLRVAQTRFHSTNLPMQAADGILTMDFSYLDEWMEMAKTKRLACFRYLMGGDPLGYPETMTLEKALFTKLNNGRNTPQQFIARHQAFREKPETAGVLPEIRSLYTQWVQRFANHAKERNWPRLVLEPFDEPAKWVYPSVFPTASAGCLGSGAWTKFHFKDCARLIHEATKDALVGATIHHAKPGLPFLSDADLVSTNAIHEDLALGDKVRAAGKIFWQYTGCNAAQPPAIPRYTCGFYFGAFESAGGVTWALNFSDRFDLSGSDWWAYSWYTPFGTITSPAYEGLREGLDDRRLIETCRKQFRGNAKAEGLLQAVLKEAVACRARGGTDTVADFYNSPTEVLKLDAWRNRLLDELLKP